MATEQAVEEDLREMARCEVESSWTAAGAALERAKGRLGKHGATELRSRLEQGGRDLELVARLDAIRLNRARIVGGSWDFVYKRSDEEYEAAFREGGLGQVEDAPPLVASRVRASKIQTTLLAALDDWAICASPKRQEWIVEVARQADRDSPAWHALARDPATWKDKATLMKVVADAPVAEKSLPLLLSLEERLYIVGEDTASFLKRVQQAHPDDFWVNLRLGNLLRTQKKPGQAVGYYQAALALRPDSAIVSNNLGMTLWQISRREEAIEPLRRAVMLDPSAAVTRSNLALNLTSLGRHVEAIDQIRLALELDPESALLHCALGISLDATNRPVEAEGEYRQALRLDPKLGLAQKGLPTTLIRQGRLDEARLAWEKALTLDPPDHDVWDGYAELCLFLGQEAEYRRASRALIGRFQETPDAAIAERTGRTALLLPVSEAEALRAATLIDRALASQDKKKPTWSYPYYLFAKGLAEYRLDRLDNAIVLLQGQASKVLVPAPQLIMAMAQHRKGRTDEARKTLAGAVLAFDWRAAGATNREVWIFHLLRREAERMILPELDSFLKGTYRPRDNDERLALLGACQFANRPHLAAGLYAEAFAEAPELAEDRSGHRYNAACAAALAGRGEGDALDEAERTRWRRKAREWLRADLDVWGKALNGDPTRFRDPVRKILNKWQSEPELSGLREQAELDKLPAEERTDWLTLWTAVKSVLDRVEQIK